MEQAEFNIKVREIYPKRAGDQNWIGALRAAATRVRQGHTYEEMLAGAGRYAAYIRSIGNERTPYVKQASTFFGPDLHFTAEWESEKSITSGDVW